jgi:hypothetical protein
MTGAYQALIGLIGLGLGGIIWHGAAAVATLIAVVFVAPLAGLAQTPAGKFLPELIAGSSLSATQPATQAGMLSPWAGLGIICGYAVVLLAVGGRLLTLRDTPDHRYHAMPGLTVVIGEDATLFREGLARLIESRGHEVAEAVADGGTLLAAVARHHPDVVVADVRMRSGPPLAAPRSTPRWSAISSAPASTPPGSPS